MIKRPENAVVLFDGGPLTNWRRRDGGTVGWRVEDGVMAVVPGTGDIVSEEKYLDALIHVEWREPDMPEATGQGKGNSGVFVQGRYEIQVLDSYGWESPGKGDCGGLYGQFAPLVNACKPALEWQAYDIIFRAARLDESGQVTEMARLTVVQNGQVIHNNVLTLGPTAGPVDLDEGTPGPLLLQDHGDLVQYRNVWLAHLPLSGSDDYDPH